MTEPAQVKLIWEPPFARPDAATEIWASFRPYIGSDPLPVIRLEVSYSDLGPVSLGGLTVDPSLIPADAADTYKVGSLNRLETAQRSRLPVEEGQTVADAVQVLRRARRLDNALQHPTGELAVLFGEFGIAYPPIDWQHAWEVVRAALVDALRVLIRLTRDVADAADEADDADAADDASG